MEILNDHIILEYRHLSDCDNLSKDNFKLHSVLTLDEFENVYKGNVKLMQDVFYRKTKKSMEY